jgi:Ca-activated chloride channel family protein
VLHDFGSLESVAVYTWEFLNYYTFAYPLAAPDTLELSLDLEALDDATGYRLQIGVSSPPATQAPMNLALVIDDSCSMTGAPMETVKDFGRAVAAALHEGDILSLVTWNAAQTVVLRAHNVTGPDDPVILSALAGMGTGGSTNLSAGLESGYDLLESHFAPGLVNRLLLVSDGGANTGVTDEELIGAAAGDEDEDGIYLVGVGIADPGTYQPVLLDRVTDLGKGASVFVPDEAEARKMFTERFASTVGIAARDVQIRLDLPPGFTLVRTSAEEVSTDPEAVRPQHLSPDDAMVLHQTVSSACPDPDPSLPVTVAVTWLDPITFEPREASTTSTLGELLAQDHTLLRKGAAIVAYADALKAARDGGQSDALSVARTLWDDAAELAPGDADLAEIDSVLDAL